MTKRIIWDFDGVIADTEKLWVQVWRETLLSEKNIILTPEQELDLLVGIADKDKKINLENYFSNLVLDSEFMHKIDIGEINKGMSAMQPINGVEKVISDNRFSHCIATGATKEQHKWKMTRFRWIEKYMSPNEFYTVDMVKKGKPAPDLFLLAAKGYNKKDCIVIGDSLNDFMAARSAGIKSIAFIGAEGNNTEKYRKKCTDSGVYAVCATMNEVQDCLNKWSENLKN